MNLHVFVILFFGVTRDIVVALPVKKFDGSLQVVSVPQNNDTRKMGSYISLGDFSIWDIIRRAVGFFRELDPQNYAVQTEVYLWPDAKIPYYIDEVFDDAAYEVIITAIEEFHAHTCVRFVPYENDEVFIHLSSVGNICQSDLGYIGESYRVSLDSTICAHTKGKVIHELMHAIGFIHEHSRHDRDDYISIQWDNIRDDAVRNFYKFANTEYNDFGFPYDFGSVMHYPDGSFSSNGEKTILIKNGVFADMGQRVGFSDYDIKKINRMYEC